MYLQIFTSLEPEVSEAVSVSVIVFPSHRHCGRRPVVLVLFRASFVF